MDDSIDNQLLQRYCAGECTPQEVVAVDAWAASSRERLAMVREAQAIWARWAALRPADPDVKSAWARMDARIASVQGGRPRVLSIGRGWTSRDAATRRYLPTAGVTASGAAVLVLTIAGALIANHRSPAAQQFRIFSTAEGGRASVTLRDGTRLVLGPATELRVPADFGVRARELELSGEAYFSVVHDVRHPFAVHTGHAVVRDVGTEFVVRAYREDDVERIAVSAGRVVVTAGRGANDTIPASAGDVATVDRAGRLTLRSGMDVSRYVAWMQGTIVFDDAPIRDVIRDIKRTYGVELSLADTSLATRTVTASFRGTEAAADVLDAIAHAVGARVEWDGARAILIRHLAGRAVTLPINTVQTRTLHP